jgi:hypothetical protein
MKTSGDKLMAGVRRIEQTKCEKPVGSNLLETSHGGTHIFTQSMKLKKRYHCVGVSNLYKLPKTLATK